MGFDHDLPLFLCLGGEVKPPLHCLAPAGKQIERRVFQGAACITQADRLTEGCRVPMHSPLHIQLHQLAYVEAELDVGDSTAGIGLAAGTRTQWHWGTWPGTASPPRPGAARGQPPGSPGRTGTSCRVTATHWKCLMMREGSVISLGMWVTINVRATWGRRRGRGWGWGPQAILQLSCSHQIMLHGHIFCGTDGEGMCAKGKGSGAILHSGGGRGRCRTHSLGPLVDVPPARRQRRA